MNSLIRSTTVPSESLLFGTLGRASFRDAHNAPLEDPTLTLTEIAARLLGATPVWANNLMRLRNSMVRRIGLKDVGDLKLTTSEPVNSVQPGDTFGIFKVFVVTERELVLGIDDSHLDVRVSVVKLCNAEAATYTISTVVYIHNWVGRLYMLPVALIHPLIVRSNMRRARV